MTEKQQSMGIPNPKKCIHVFLLFTSRHTDAKSSPPTLFPYPGHAQQVSLHGKPASGSLGQQLQPYSRAALCNIYNSCKGCSLASRQRPDRVLQIFDECRSLVWDLESDHERSIHTQHPPRVVRSSSVCAEWLRSVRLSEPSERNLSETSSLCLSH